MQRIISSTTGRVVALVTVLAMCLLTTQAATATDTSGTNGNSATARTARTASQDLAKRQVAKTHQGSMATRIVGSTAGGKDVTGAFVPLKFVKRHGHVLVRGLVEGVVHGSNGHTSRFATMRTIKVKSINGTPAHAGRAGAGVAACDILHLVLAPLDLDLLGLKVHLDRVVLDIVAQSGAGNLLGNLLCAVTGLLDGGLGGLLGRLTNLLNQILGALRLG